MVDGVCYSFNRLPMGFATSPFFLQRILEEILAPIRSQAVLSWVHVDDFLIIAQPQDIEQLRNTLMTRLQTAGFTINEEKSQLQPTTAIDYLGLRINMQRRYFALDKKHLNTFRKLVATDLSALSTRVQRSVRGFLSFVLSTTVRQYAFINAPLQDLVSLIKGIRDIAGFFVRFRPPRKPPYLYVDATPTQLGILDVSTRQAFAIPHKGHQAQNELLALILAVSLFGQTRRYITDVTASLYLQKRSFYAFIPKVVIASLNPRIFFVPTGANWADPISRDPPGVFLW